jgi:hypothetical protein
MEHFERCAFGASRRLSHVLHVVNVQVDQIAERLGAPGTLSNRCATTVNLAFCFCRPLPSVVMPKKCLGDVPAFAPHLDAPRTRAKSRECGHLRGTLRVQILCTQASKRGEFGRIFGYKRVHTSTTKPLEYSEIMLINQAHKFSIAPMMDWTDSPSVSGIALLFAGVR